MSFKGKGHRFDYLANDPMTCLVGMPTIWKAGVSQRIAADVSIIAPPGSKIPVNDAMLKPLQTMRKNKWLIDTDSTIFTDRVLEIPEVIGA